LLYVTTAVAFSRYARRWPRSLLVVGVVMVVVVVVMMVVVVRLPGGDDDLRLRGRVQDKAQTQRTECEQTSLDVTVHDRLPEPGFLRSNHS
jgi:hypothetical protein